MVVVAAQESDVLLHVADALWAFHLIRNPSRSAQELEAAAGARVAVNLAMVVHARYIKTLCDDMLLPFLVSQKGRQNSGAVAIDKCKRSLAEYSPPSFLVVAEEFLDFMHHGVLVVRLP